MANTGVSVEVLAECTPLSALFFTHTSVLNEFGSLSADQTVAWQDWSDALTSITVELLASWAGRRAEELTFAHGRQKAVSFIARKVTH